MIQVSLDLTPGLTEVQVDIANDSISRFIVVQVEIASDSSSRLNSSSGRYVSYSNTSRPGSRHNSSLGSHCF